MDFKSDLIAVQAESDNINLYVEVLNNIANWKVTESSEDKESVAQLFYYTLKAIQSIRDEQKIEEFYEYTIKAFENINQIGRDDDKSSTIIIINFLNELYQRRNKLSSKIQISQSALQILLKDLEPIKFIFNISDDKCLRYFPINKLLGNIIMDRSFINIKIEPYHINLIQLAVEMYEATGEKNNNDQLNKLITTSNLRFINYLNGACIRVDTSDMSNFKNNQVMVFYDINKKKVLIRHEDKKYFQGLIENEKIQLEYNASRREIGYFVELIVEGDTIDYSEALKESPKEFLRLLYEKKYKNILLEKMIVKMQNGEYKPLNPFCMNDNWIIKGKIDGRAEKICTLDKIRDSIEEGRLHLFSLSSKPTVLNKISLGLCMTLLDNKEIAIDDLFAGLESNEWIQNIIFKNLVSYSDNSLNTLEFILKKYANDLDYCSKENDILNLEFNKAKIRDSLPFMFDLSWVYELMKMPKTACLFHGTINEEGSNFYVDFAPTANKSLAKINMDKINLISADDVILSEETNKYDFFIDKQDRYFIFKDDEWHSSMELQDIYKLIVNIELNNQKMINYKLNERIHNDVYKEIKDIMMLHLKELEDISIKKIDVDSLIILRLLNNLLLNKINADNWDHYYNLFSKQQKLSFSEIVKCELFSKNKKDVLIVPKDRSQEDAVLRKVYENYIRKNAERDDDWWFTSKTLYMCQGAFYRDKSKIQTIRFLFDNTEHGTATIRSIAAYFGKKQEWIKFVQQTTEQETSKLERLFEIQTQKCQKYQYQSGEISLIDIATKNDTKIEACSYYGTDKGDKSIKEFLTSCGFNESKVQVSHCHEITQKAVLVKKDCDKLEIEYNDSIYLVVREFNMTKKYLLPKGAVGKANKVVTLLVKKTEL